MEPTNYTGEERVRMANEQALRGDVGGALVDGGITRAGENEVRDPSNTSVITSSDLSSGSRAYTIPEVSTSSVADSIVAQTGAQAEMSALQREQQQKLTEAQTATNEARSGYKGVIDKVLGVVGSRGKLEEDAKISEKAVASDEARIALETSQRAMTNELRALTGRGLTDVQKAAEQREITRKYAFEQADLSLTLDVAERRLDRAQKTIDRKIELQLEPLKYELEFNKSFYEENKDLLSKADQRLFNTKISGLEKQYSREEEDRKAVRDLNLKLIGKGITPPSNLLNAKDAVEWSTNATKQGINLSKEEKSSEYRGERNERIITSIDELLGKTNWQTVGFASLGRFAPGSVQRDYKADLETLKANISFSELQAMREASKTGGALGQVAIRELELLESTLGALDQGQSPANMRKNLEKIRESIARFHEARGGSTGDSYKAGDIVEYQGKRYRVGSDGDTLTEI